MSTSYAGFVGEVQHRIEAESRAEAVRTVRSVLETLGERLEEGGATDLASPLPKEIDRYLLQVDHGRTYDYDAFVDRATAKMTYDDLDIRTSYGRPSAVDRSDVVYRIKVVMALLSETVPGGEMADVEAQLPDEFDSLFEFVGSETPPWEQSAA